MNMTDFHFLRPYWLLGYIGIFTLVIIYKKTSSNVSYKKYFSPHILKHLINSDGITEYFNIFYIVIYMLSLLVFILSGPTYKKIKTPYNVDHSKVMLAFQLTPSMNQEDILPSRLERAKIKMLEFIELNNSSKVGVSVYSESSFLILPFTMDREILIPFIKALSTDIMPNEGANARSLLELTGKHFKKGEKGQNLLLISDGVTNEDIKSFKQLSIQQNFNLVVYGVGTDSSSQAYIKLNSSSLSKLAKEGEGVFIKYTIGRRDLREINSNIPPYYPPEQNMNVPWEELGYYLSFFMGIPLLMLFRKGAVVTFVLIFTFISPIEVKAFSLLDPWLTKDQQGYVYYKLGRYKRAATTFEDKLWKAKSFYLAEDFKNAELVYMSVKGAEALFNVANAVAHQGFYLSASEIYEDLSNEFPDDERYKINLKIVNRIIEETDQLAASQQNEGNSELKKLPKGSRKKSRGAEKNDLKESKSNKSQEEIGPEDVDVWFVKINSDLGDFMARKIGILNEKND